MTPRSSHLSRTTRPAAALLALALLAGCGDDGPASSTAPASSSVASTLSPTTTAQGTATTSTPATTVTTVTSGPLGVDPDGTSTVDPGALAGRIDALPKAALTTAEADGLIFMREEERLAEDVYRALYARWNLQVFANIAGAEATHTASVKTLLDRYQLADPVAGRAAGTYKNAAIQALYTSLVAQGSRSLVDALTVGATIEDLDIADLRARVSTTPDIALVYANLDKGSRNHLRSFVSQLRSRGAGYTPAHITQAEFDSIVSTPIERGSAG
jgi:hypothetical protein